MIQLRIIYTITIPFALIIIASLVLNSWSVIHATGTLQAEYERYKLRFKI